VALGRASSVFVGMGFDASVAVLAGSVVGARVAVGVSVVICVGR
jgi:hypothetical protein